MRVRSASMAERSSDQASSIVLAHRRGHRDLAVEALGLGRPRRRHLEQASVAGPQVVLAVVEGGPPPSSFERPPVVRFDEDPVAAGPDGRSAQVHRHGSSVNDGTCGSSVPIACAQPGDEGPVPVGIARSLRAVPSVGSRTTRRQGGAGPPHDATSGSSSPARLCSSPPAAPVTASRRIRPTTAAAPISTGPATTPAAPAAADDAWTGPGDDDDGARRGPPLRRRPGAAGVLRPRRRPHGRGHDHRPRRDDRRRCAVDADAGDGDACSRRRPMAGSPP